MTAPAYRRIAERLRQQIADGTYPPGSQLPPESTLARTFRVSTRTVHEATRLLLEAGEAVSKPGAGTFVAVRLDPVAWPLRGGLEDPRPAVSSEPGPAPASVAARLGIPVGGRVMRTRYVHSPTALPGYLVTSWEPMALTAGTVVLLPEDGPHAGAGVGARMAAIGHPVTRVLEDAAARLLTPGEAGLLGVRPGIAVVVVERTRFSGDAAVETADVVLPPPYRARYDTGA